MLQVKKWTASILSNFMIFISVTPQIWTSIRLCTSIPTVKLLFKCVSYPGEIILSEIFCPYGKCLRFYRASETCTRVIFQPAGLWQLTLNIVCLKILQKITWTRNKITRSDNFRVKLQDLEEKRGQPCRQQALMEASQQAAIEARPC